MLVIIYIAFTVVLLLACSVWAMRKKDRGVQAVFAVGSALIGVLLIPLLSGVAFDATKRVALFIVGNFLFVDVLLLTHALIGALKQKG